MNMNLRLQPKMVKPIEEKLQCLSTWTTVIFVITVLVLVITICNVVLTLSIRNNSIPHTYQIFGTGSDVEPGPGLPPPFSPTFGALAKGSFTVGDCCLKWELLYLNFTQLPTSLNLHGLLYKDNDTAPMLENLIGMEDKELPDGFLIRKKQHVGILRRCRPNAIGNQRLKKSTKDPVDFACLEAPEISLGRYLFFCPLETKER